MASATVSPIPEHLLVLAIETNAIVPLATSSSALSTVQVYGHLLDPFRNEWQVPAFITEIYVGLPVKQ